jgi:hypothetical protein
MPKPNSTQTNPDTQTAEEEHKVYLPFVTRGSTEGPSAGTKKIVVDPLTRIEGHLRVVAQVEY